MTSVPEGLAVVPLADVARLEREAVDITRALIRIESVNTGHAATIGDGETRAALLVRDLLDEVGIESELVEPRPGRGSLVARIPGRDRARGALVVHAHLDVVPVEADDWTHPPFAAEVVDGWLYGRGAVDMKNFAGAVVAAARHFARHGIRPERDLVLLFLADEEAGGRWGAEWIAKKRPDLLEGATESLGEVGGFSFPLPAGGRGYLAATSEKGVATVTVTARGEASHGSVPRAGNTVVRLARAIERIADHRFPVVRTPALDRFLGIVAAGESDPDVALAGVGVLAPFLAAGLRTTASPTVLAGGLKTNVIPASASVRLDVRTVPGQDEAELRAELARVAGDDVDVHWHDWSEGWESPADAPLLDAFQVALEAEDPDGVVVPYLLPASTDNKHFARLGIHGYGFIPLRVPDDFDVFAQFHAADERIPVAALEFSARVTTRLLASA